MKTRTKILIPTVVFLATGLFYLFMVANGYSPYDHGISLTLYSDYQIDEFLKQDNENFIVPKITDDDLKDVPELKQLIEKALSKKYPLNPVGRVHITFEELNDFHHQYSEILSKKYSKDYAEFFTINRNYMPEKYLAIEPTVYLRTFEGHYFEYQDKQYGIGPNTLYIPFMEDENLLRLEVYKTNGPLREKDHT